MSAYTTTDYLSFIHQGVPPTAHPQKVIIVGAGMSGLAAADIHRLAS